MATKTKPKKAAKSSPKNRGVGKKPVQANTPKNNLTPQACKPTNRGVVIGQDKPIESDGVRVVKKGRPFNPDCVPLSQLIQDYCKGLTCADIGRKHGLTRQTIHLRLKPLKALLDNTTVLKEYRKNKSDILDKAELTLLTDLMQDKRRKGAKLKDIAASLKVVHDANRLQKGQSTGNVHMKAEAFVSIVHDLANQYKQTSNDPDSIEYEQL